MRVGILSQWFPPESGPASIPGVLARGLVERGHEVVVVTGFPNYPTGTLYDGYRIRPHVDSTEHGYALRRVALYPDHSPRIRGRLLNYGSFAATATAFGTSAFRDVEVLWVYNSPATVALPMWLAKGRFRLPVVLHNMDMWPDSVVHTGFNPRRGSSVVLGGLNAWVDAMYRSATSIAYVSRSSGEELYQRGVPREKLHYAPIWIDESVFHPADGSALRRRLGYSDHDVVIGYAGALGKAQSVVELAEAVIAQPDSSRLRCLVLGSGTEADRIAQLAVEHPGRLRYLGQVPHAAMTEHAAVPDVSYVGLSPGGQAAFAQPSKIPAIMACGKPLLAAVDGDSAELVRSTGTGVVTPPGDFASLSSALRTIEAFSHARLREMGTAARTYYESERSQSVSIDRMELILAKSGVEAAPRRVPQRR